MIVTESILKGPVFSINFDNLQVIHLKQQDIILYYSTGLVVVLDKFNILEEKEVKIFDSPHSIEYQNFMEQRKLSINKVYNETVDLWEKWKNDSVQKIK